ncbi:KRE5 [Candida oxycetoniae]|uniref:KRE5 n=1 Tax=Candida oxycetoniae TaxID=497107 RepID=A0AAI9T1J3_9ASCO|nr:KRE5 [Candida oxycetoniae]KAI3406722.2 KRE5 [Candida oxycetoniae]
MREFGPELYKLYLVTDSTMVPKSKTFLGQVKEAIENGVTIVQLREKTLSTREFIEQAKKVHELTKLYKIPLIINDRVDVAIAVDAEGVHVGQDDMPAKLVRQMIGDDKILGVTCSTPKEVQEVMDDDVADYVGLGTVFATTTKKDVKNPGGIGPIGIREMLKVMGKHPRNIASVAIGGINETNINFVTYSCRVTKKAIDGVAVVSCIMASEDAAAATMKLLENSQQGYDDGDISSFNNEECLSNDKHEAKLKKLLDSHPLVHHITNNVVKNFSANVTLAIGASPIMSELAEEFEEFASKISNMGLVLNLGTPSEQLMEVFLKAMKVYNQYDKPIVFDPVACGASKNRLDCCRRILNVGRVRVIKGNIGEIMAIWKLTSTCLSLNATGSDKNSMRGVDSTANVSEEILTKIAKDIIDDFSVIVVITGPTNYIYSTENRFIKVEGGSKLMSLVTGTGCSLASVIAAFLAAKADGTTTTKTSHCDYFACVAAAVKLYNDAGRIAASKCQAPSSFMTQFIDEFATAVAIRYDTIRSKGMVREGQGKFPVKKVNRPSPVANVGKIGSLTRYPDREYANSLLHDAVKALAPVIHEYGFKVGLLCEMFPKSPNLLGLNINKGQKIMLRLRYHHNDKSFLPMCDIIGTLLHELTHNVHGPHNKLFYDYLAELEKKYYELQVGNVMRSGYRCEENVLGRGNLLGTGLVDVRARRLATMNKPKFKTETLQLASDSKVKRPENLRQAILDAAQRRLLDSKQCSSHLDAKEEIPTDQELEIVELDDEDDNGGNNDEDETNGWLNSGESDAKIEIIDLTEENDDNNNDENLPLTEEIISSCSVQYHLTSSTVVAVYGTSPIAVAVYGTSPIAVAVYGTSPIAVAPYGTSPIAVAVYGTSPIAVAVYGTSPIAVAPYGTSPIAVAPYVSSAIENGGEVVVAVDATWPKLDFITNFIESLAGFNETLYIPAIELIFGLGEDEEEEELDIFAADEKVYKTVVEKLKLDQSSIDIINFNLAHKKFAPRIVAHFSYYERKLCPIFKDKLQTVCAHDSFGEPVETKNGALTSWVLCNDKIYCSANDLFALRTDKSTTADIQLFDRVIGNNVDSPLLEFYGDPMAESTRNILKVLYQEANSNKLRFVWRYIPSSSKTADSLSGYAAHLTLNSGKNQIERPFSSDLTLQRDFQKINNSNELIKADENLNNVGTKLISFLFSNKYKLPRFDILKTILNDLPKYMYYLQNHPKDYHFEKAKTKIASNEETGLSKDSYGVYVNGSPIHPLELDIFKLEEKIQNELKIITDLVSLGFSTVQAKLLITKFALLSAVKQTQFESGNTLMGNNENRFKVYENVFNRTIAHKGGVVLFNDIENDRNYDTYSSDRNEVYLGAESLRLKSNQLPPLRENIHDLIFAINFSNKQQLKAFFTLSKLILDTGIPQQLGLIPIVADDPLDKELAKRLYRILEVSTPIEAMAFLYSYMEAKNSSEIERVLNKVEITDDFEIDIQAIARKFSITLPSVIINGVIHDMSQSNWQILMSKQIAQDVSLLKSYLRQGPVEGKLKDLLYLNAKTERDLRIHPQTPKDVLYKLVNKDLFKVSFSFKKIDKPSGVSVTFWLISDFGNQESIKQLCILLEFMKKTPIQIRVVNLGNTKFFTKPHGTEHKLTSSLTNFDIEKLIDSVKSVKLSTGPNLETRKVLEKAQLPTQHSYMLLNSRYLRLEPAAFSVEDLTNLVDFETKERLKIIDDVVQSYPDTFSFKLDEYNSVATGIDNMDWFDLVSSIVTKSFHTDEKLFVVDVNRFDFDSLDMSNSIDVVASDETKPIDVLVIIDPLEEYAQKVVNMLDFFSSFSFLNIRILLQPISDFSGNKMPNRFYRGVYPNSLPMFDRKGRWLQNYAASGTFNSLPLLESYSLNLDVPSKWVVVPKSIAPSVDLNNFTVKDKKLSIKYRLSNLIIQGYARDIYTGKAPNNLTFELSQDSGKKTDTLVMSALNYFQLKATPGVNTLKCGSDHALLSASCNKFDSNLKPLEGVDVPVFSLVGATLYPRIIHQSNESKEKKPSHSQINIFSIANGEWQSEKSLSIMIASVRKHTSSSVKFWILNNYVSPTFQQLVPLLEEKYNVAIELITYKWPEFLRKQENKRERELAGYKILFLDVLFPQDLERVIFMSCEQICRSDLIELVNMDLEEAPYAFATRGDSRLNMDKFKFWRQGYWADMLANEFIYHFSDLFIVDLDKFRKFRFGDSLRRHYQKLSSDANTLVRVDLDLINSLQRQIPIKTLPQEWQWSEKWCCDEDFANAKEIDLSSLLTNENIHQAGKRLVPEWTRYEEEIDSLVTLTRVNQLEEEEEEDKSQIFHLNDGNDGNDGSEEFDYHDEL